MITREDYTQLCEQIWKHNRLYYIEHQPQLSDKEYDLLFKKLEQIERDHPDWITATSPTQRVNESLTEGFKTVKHSVPMLSLANTYSKKEIEEFIQRIEKLVGGKHSHFIAELKMDGIAVSVTYEKGIFVRGVTRGNGKQGDDITTNLRTILALPLCLHGEDIPDLLELRGEVYMLHDVFQSLNEQKLQSGEDLWANPRNAAAGSLKLLNPQEVSVRKLSIVFYGIAEDSSSKLKLQSEVAPYLHSLGLPTLNYTKSCHTLEEIWQSTEEVNQLRTTLAYDIDGVVIKLDEFREQNRLGYTGKNPRWAIAYKFSAEQATTKIKEITVQIGRTGILTPVAELEPVLLAGSTIARATLHNEDEIRRKDIRIGDHVIIEKGGDVIPKVVSVCLDKRLATSEVWQMPTTCPCCETSIIRIEDEVAVRCPNEKGCKEQLVRRLIYFTSKAAMDINHMGEKVVIQLFEKGFIKTPSDIYTLTEQQLAQLNGFKEKSIQNVLISIEQSKTVSLSHFIMALGIKHIGSGTAELLAERIGNVFSLMSLKEEELLNLEGIGEIVAQSVVDYFKQPEHVAEVERLLKLGVEPSVQSIKVLNHPLFQGKSFVLTGTLKEYTRTTAASMIKERGGKVPSTISKKTDYLVAGEDPGSKVDKARRLQVTILNEEEFVRMLFQ